MKHIFIIISIFILGVLILAYYLVYAPVDANSAESSVFLVKKGDGLNQISVNLQNEGLIRNRYLFAIYALHKNEAKNLIAGQYELSKSMAIPDILEKISSGDRIKRMVTIIEGWTVRDIEEHLNMGEIDESLEGYLFPDTYEVFPEEKLEDIIKRMEDNFGRKVASDLKDEMARQGKSLADIITMASIIEKEVQTIEDKKIVSGILWKRLKNNMPLQVDSTISYITRRKSTELTKEELAIKSPYNTYLNKGLPPGPICNPGINSIEAAVYPFNTKYWFYLSTREGETIFSSTLEEHEQARQEYLK